MKKVTLNQSPVVFNSVDHTYRIGDMFLKGVTGSLVRRAYPDTYAIPEGFTEEQWKERLKNAASKGTNVHQTIELYEDLGVVSNSPELSSYIDIKEGNGFKNIATEYIVSDEKNYASSIDHVWVTNDEEEIILVDIKHTYQIHEQEVICQLSVYKRFFLMQNPHLADRKVIIALLWLRGEKSEFRILSPMADEVLDALIDADLKGKTFDIQKHYGELPQRFADVEDQISVLYREIKEKKALYEEMTKGLLEIMKQYGVNKFTGQKIQLTVTKPSKRESFDMDAFKSDHLNLYEEYKTYTDIKPSLRITIKN